MLGQKVNCVVTGVVGTAIAKIEYMNGCIQYQIQPKKVVIGVPVEAKWYDNEQVVLVESKKVVEKRRGGGPPPSVVPNRCKGIV